MEKFKQIKGYENYLVSDQGRVFNFKYNRFLKPRKNNRGYFLVNLCKIGVMKTLKVHRLVALAYIPNPENKRTVNHLDGVKTNNYVDNLEWCTQKENVRHAYDTGLKDNKGIKHYRAKLSEKEVLEIRRLYKTGNYTQKDLGEMFGVDHSHISNIINRKTWKHI